MTLQLIDHLIHNLVLKLQPLVPIGGLNIIDETSPYVPIDLVMVNGLLLIERIEIWWRETSEVYRRIALFGIRIDQFNFDEDDLLDDIWEVHMVDTR